MLTFRKILLLGCWCIFFGVGSYGQTNNYPLYLNHLTTQDGLSSQSYNDFIFQDSKGFVWISSVDGLNRFDGDNVKQYKADPSEPNAINNNVIYSDFFEDDSTNLWFSTVLGIQQYIRKKDHFRPFSLGAALNKTNKIKQDQVQLLYLDKANQEIWVRIDSFLYIKSMYSSDPARLLGKFSSTREMKVLTSPLSKKTIVVLVPFNDFLLVHHFAPNDAGVITEKSKSDTVRLGSIPKYIYTDSNGGVWIGTADGLFAYDIMNAKSTYFEDSPKDLKAIAEGENDQLWLGTENGKLYLFNRSNQQFSDPLDQIDDQQVKVFDNKISSLKYFSDHTLWIVSPGKGVFFTNLRKRKFYAFLQNKAGTNPGFSDVKDLAVDKQERVWCLTAGGVMVLNSEGQKVEELESINNEVLKPENNFLFNIFCDQAGGIWVSSMLGLYYLPSNEVSFKKIDNRLFSMVYQLSDGVILGACQRGILELDSKKDDQRDAPIWEFTSQNFYSYIFEDSSGTVYLAEMGNKLLLVDRSRKNAPFLSRQIPLSPQVTDIIEDVNQEHVWVGTKEGLFHMSTNPDMADTLKRDDLNTAMAVNGLQRQGHVLWLSTNNGLIKYDTITKKNHRYLIADGLQEVEFNFGSSLKLKSGLLAFGGINGLNIFDPKNIRPLETMARGVITDIRVNDKTLVEADVQCSATGASNPGLIEFLRLPYRQNTLEFHFAALEYSDPRALSFEYRLLGMDKDWIRSEEERSVRYAGLRPDKYVFELRAANSDGQLSDNILRVRVNIRPPWYWNPVAQAIYVLFFVGMVIGFYRWRLYHKLKLAETQKWIEMNEFKNRFISNITHELKTPLSGILLSAESLSEEEDERVSILQSTEEMQQIIRRILSLAKLRSGSLALSLEKGDIVQFLDFQTRSYASLAALNNIDIQFVKNTDKLIMDFDPEKVKDIIRNLLSNAIKFNKPYGKVKVSVNKTLDQHLLVQVQDTGQGMDKETLDNIFKRYYQGGESSFHRPDSTGIGLSYVSELIAFLNGVISAESVPGEGSTFSVKLPVSNEEGVSMRQEGNIAELNAVAAATEGSFLAEITGPTNESGGKMNVLIVEDNVSILKKLLDMLKNKFNVISALDGEKGVELAIEMVPDIIISDVKMPKKDGYQLCEELKSNKTTSHIPIILLTAMSGQHWKNKGLIKGAEAYLEKPFNAEELTIRLEKLIETRKALQDRFIENNTHSLLIKETGDIEDEFIAKIRAVILDNPENISVKDLAEEMEMNRNQLYKKIMALTGRNTQRFIARVRLEWARDILADPTEKLNISEVAYKVGFKDVPHFSKSFRAFFGYTPSDLRR